MMDNRQDLSYIAGTLKYGDFSGEKRKYIIIAYVILTVLMVGGMAALITVVSLEQAVSPDTPGWFAFTVIMIAVGFLSVPILLLVIIIKNEQSRKEILLWLNDAVKLQAFAKKIGEYNESIFFSTVKIQVDFELDGIFHSCESKGKQRSRGKEGYQYIWTKYADRPLEILYSPKYNEVMILKDN